MRMRGGYHISEAPSLIREAKTGILDSELAIGVVKDSGIDASGIVLHALRKYRWDSYNMLDDVADALERYLKGKQRDGQHDETTANG